MQSMLVEVQQRVDGASFCKVLGGVRKVMLCDGQN